MKKITIFLVIITIISSFLCPVTSYADTPDYENIKIGLFFDSTSKDKVTLKCDSGFEMGYQDEFGEFNMISVLLETEIVVFVNEEGYIAIENIYVNTDYPNLEIRPGFGNMLLDGHDYRGSFIFMLNDTGLMTVINYVNLEEYLYSVLGREMSPSWPIEALKAQAICARTYAIISWDKYASKGFNLDNSQNSQVYDGMRSEGERTIQAVDETKGMILMYDGAPAQTFYYSSSGGKTANVKYVWGSEIPYLVSVEDDYENPEENVYASWSTSFSPEEIKELLKKSDKDIGDITGIDIKGVDNGTVYDVVINGTKGTHQIKNGSVRSFFGLRSQYFTLTPPGKTTIYPEMYILGANGRNTITTDKISLYPDAKAEEITVLSANGVNTFSPTIKDSGDKYVFNGHGWGHRIGMSQWGAKGMADRGLSAEDILTHYFRGCYIEAGHHPQQ